METSQENLRKEVRRSTTFAFWFSLLIVAAYPILFGVFDDGTVSNDPAAWGQLGDYLGGLLNPLVAFMAFYWLTRSVLLQRQELQDTKIALKESAASQSKQEGHAQTSVRVAALGAILVSYNNDIAGLRQEIGRLNDVQGGQDTRGADGLRIRGRDLPGKIGLLAVQLGEVTALRDAVIAQINGELPEAVRRLEGPNAG